jgi:uncharacterized protein YndB with AHSA1/START domain
MSAANRNTKDYTGREFTITHEFAAKRELVFEAWTDARHLAQWWGPRGFTNPVCEWDAKPGKAIRVVMRGPNGVDYPMGGEFREIAAPERLVFTSGALDEKGDLLFEFLHTVTFKEQNGKTTVTILSRVLKTTAGTDKYIDGFEAGMTQSLGRLVEHLAAKIPAFVIERTFNAPVALVWQALIDPKAMAEWYFEIKDFKPEVGHEFHFSVEHEGFTYAHRCKVMKVTPEKKLAYTWRYDGYEGDSLVTFELFAEGAKTRLKLTHEGLESFPKQPSFARKNFAGGWTSLIGSSLMTFVEGTGDREMVIARDFDAPRELIWEVWTNPKHVANWWGPRGFSTTTETMDVRPGGIWKHTMRGADGAEYPNHSVFIEVVKPARIVYSHGGEKKGGPSVRFESTWTFDELEPGRTRVTLRGVFPTAKERDFVVKEFGAIEGGKQTLERLGEYLTGLK